MKKPKGGATVTCAGTQQGHPSATEKQPGDYTEPCLQQPHHVAVGSNGYSELITLPPSSLQNFTDALSPNRPLGFENPGISGGLKRKIWGLFTNAGM